MYTLCTQTFVSLSDFIPNEYSDVLQRICKLLLLCELYGPLTKIIRWDCLHQDSIIYIVYTVQCTVYTIHVT